MSRDPIASSSCSTLPADSSARSSCRCSTAGFEIHTWRTADAAAPPLHVGEIDGLIGLGGIMHPDEDIAHPWLPEVRAMYRQAVARQIPTLGVCLGVQLMSQALGGSAGPLGRLRVGFLPVEFRAGDDPLLGGLPETLRPLSWHEYVAVPPEGAIVLAAADGTPQAVRFGPLAWGVQFHAELGSHVDRWFEHGSDPLPRPWRRRRGDRRRAARDGRDVAAARRGHRRPLRPPGGGPARLRTT